MRRVYAWAKRGVRQRAMLQIVREPRPEEED
jgi:hypothetical protein